MRPEKNILVGEDLNLGISAFQCTIYYMQRMLRSLYSTVVNQSPLNCDLTLLDFVIKYGAYMSNSLTMLILTANIDTLLMGSGIWI